MIRSNVRGNPIIYKNGQWVYTDGVPIDKEERPCARCGRKPTKDGYDPCLGHIDGAKHACCDHGIDEPYVLYN